MVDFRLGILFRDSGLQFGNCAAGLMIPSYWLHCSCSLDNRKTFFYKTFLSPPQKKGNQFVIVF